jgi:hypothetical protein
VDEVGEGGVAEAVPGEVAVDAGEEVLLAEPGDELAQRRGALGVGDAVEVEPRGGGVGHPVGVGGDGVRGGPLVGVVTPALAGDGEVGPGAGEAGGLGEDLEAHVLGEGLVEPDVVPPRQGDEITEPHMGHLMGDDHGPGLLFGVRDGGAEDELVAEGDQSGILHGAEVELGHERLVVRVEGVGLVEDLVVPVEAAPRDVQQFVGIGVELGGERPPHMKSERQPGVLHPHRMPGPGGERHEIGADGRGRREPPAAAAELLGDAVAEHGPLWRRGDRRLQDGLEIGLVEGRENLWCIGHAAHGVEIGLAVGRVGEAVHALAGPRVPHIGLDAQFVLARGQPGQRQPPVGERRRPELLPVEDGPVEGGRADVDETVRGLARGEPDNRGGAEQLLATRQIEIDGVPVNVEDACSGLRFVACECGHAAMLPYGADAVHGRVDIPSARPLGAPDHCHAGHHRGSGATRRGSAPCAVHQAPSP